MVDRISGKRKAALLLLALGRDSTVQLFKNLNEDEVSDLTMELARISKVSPKEQDSIIEEFYYDSKAQSYISRDGVKYCLLYTSPSPRDRQKSRMPSSA